jgi:hypothetical protein
MHFSHTFLKNFPGEIVELVKQKYYENFSNKNDLLIQNEVQNLNYKILKAKNIYSEILNYKEFENNILFLISKPKMGMAIIHRDKSRIYTINIPIIVDHEKSDFVIGKHKNISDYGENKETIINGKKALAFNYNEEDYQFIKLDYPILANTGIPHSWTNYSNKHRVIASLSFNNIDTYEEAFKLCEKWI